MERRRLLELAIIGVKQELSTLENELAAISKGVAVGAKTLVSSKLPRKKRRMSAAAKKAISEAKRKWWAERKAKSKK